MSYARNAESETGRFDVIVVGLGPVGITLANLLGSAGVRVLGIDAAADVYDKPRAIGLDHEVLRVFQQIGVADRLGDSLAGYRDTEYRSADGEILRLMISPSEPYPLSWPPYATFVQPDLERVLRDRAGEQPSVELRLNCRALDLRNAEERPTLDIEDTTTGESRTVSAKFVVGCDGASSLVRRILGIALEDLIFDEPWLVVDVLIDDESAWLPDVNVQYCDPARPHTFVVLPRNLRRWEFMLLPGEDPDTMKQEEVVWSLLSPWLKPGQARIWRAASYRFHALVAPEWRKGNVFLAGDACHQTPPFLAQGMVQGIKDANNLYWKLIAVLGGAPSRLLDTYTRERRPLVREVISITKDLGAIIGETDPQKAETRNARMLADMASGNGAIVRQNLFPCIQEGVLHRSHAAAAVGHPSPQPFVNSGNEWTRLDDVAGRGLRAYATADFDYTPAIRESAAGLGCSLFHVVAYGEEALPDGVRVLEERDGVMAHWLEQHQARAILVRPDQVVANAASEPDELLAALQKIGSWLAPSDT